VLVQQHVFLHQLLQLPLLLPFLGQLLPKLLDLLPMLGIFLLDSVQLILVKLGLGRLLGLVSL
jgi:hypothetical protein